MKSNPPRDVYEIPSDALVRPWVSRSFVALLNTLRNAPKQRISTIVGPALLSIAVHAFLIGSVIWGGGPPPAARSPDHVGPGSTGIVSADEPVMTLILINELSPQRPEPTEIPLASRGFAPIDLPVTLISPDASPAFDDLSQRSNGPDSVPTDDTAQRGMLFGRYIGQIRARIERAWMRPRTPIGAKSFYCVVLITQDHDGKVKETTLQTCNGDLRWQLSLVQAIQSAVPLPAPPDPKVFADAITMKFEARDFGPGVDERDYEPPIRVIQAAAAAWQPNVRLRRFEEQLHSAHGPGSGSIELTITGTPEGHQTPPGASQQRLHDLDSTSSQR